MCHECTLPHLLCWFPCLFGHMLDESEVKLSSIPGANPWGGGMWLTSLFFTKNNIHLFLALEASKLKVSSPFPRPKVPDQPLHPSIHLPHYYCVVTLLATNWDTNSLIHPFIHLRPSTLSFKSLDPCSITTLLPCWMEVPCCPTTALHFIIATMPYTLDLIYSCAWMFGFPSNFSHWIP